MTERLYFHDPYLQEFEARVLAAQPEEDGRPGLVVELDRTAFYPTAGGQLHDTGVLDGRRVREVVEAEDEVHILHHLDGAAEGEALTGRTVTGRIDWERRFDHMQQHTGQHVLSQAALRELGAATLAVHLGEERCTVDLDLATFDVDEAARLEDAANAAVMANHPVRTHFVDESEIGQWGLRRPPKKSGTIRVVEIAEVDRSACGGTHVRATGEIGVIAVTGWSRYKGGTRLEFLCGWRALRDIRAKTRLLKEIGRTVSASGPEVVDAVLRLQEDLREGERRREEVLARLALAEAALRRRQLTLPAVHGEVLPGRGTDELRALAEALVREGGLIALLVGDDGRLVFARSPELAVDAAALLRRTLDQFGGRGGGKPAFAQGTVAAGAQPEQVIEAARRWAEEDLAQREAAGA